MRQVSLQGVWQAAARYRRFPLITGISALLKGVGGQFPPLLIGAFYGPHVLGWFALCQRLLAAPIALVGQAVSQVYLGEAPQLARSQADGLRQLYIGTAKRLLFLGVGPTVVLIGGGPWLFSVVFGSVWRESGVYVQILSAAFLAQFIVSPLVQTLNILERQDLQLIADIGYPVVTVGSLLVAGVFQLPPVAAIAIYSLATFVIHVGLFALALWAIYHRSKKANGTETERRREL
jgi:O-antigen/teichoic acid export membrane protein